MCYSNDATPIFFGAVCFNRKNVALTSTWARRIDSDHQSSKHMVPAGFNLAKIQMQSKFVEFAKISLPKSGLNVLGDIALHDKVRT